MPRDASCFTSATYCYSIATKASGSQLFTVATHSFEVLDFDDGLKMMLITASSNEDVVRHLVPSIQPLHSMETYETVEPYPDYANFTFDASDRSFRRCLHELEVAYS